METLLCLNSNRPMIYVCFGHFLSLLCVWNLDMNVTFNVFPGLCSAPMRREVYISYCTIELSCPEKACKYTAVECSLKGCLFALPSVL